LLLLSRTFSAQYLLGIFLGMADGPELRSKPLGGADCPPQLEQEQDQICRTDIAYVHIHAHNYVPAHTRTGTLK